MILNLSINGNAKVMILVSSEEVSETEYNQFLSLNENYISASSIFESELGSIKKEEFYLFKHSLESFNSIETNDTVKNQILDETIIELSKGFLSPTRKKLVLQLFEKKYDLSKFENQNLKLQIQTLKQGPILEPGTIPLSLNSISTSDKLFINGIRINAQTQESVFLYPQLYYHIAILSNSKYPHFIWNKGEGLTIKYDKTPIIKGQCDKPIANFSFETFHLNSIRGLFPKNCTSEIPFSQIQIKDRNSPEPQLFLSSELSHLTNSSNEPILIENLESSKNYPWWKWTMGAILLGVLYQHYEKNNPQINFSF